MPLPSHIPPHSWGDKPPLCVQLVAKIFEITGGYRGAGEKLHCSYNTIRRTWLRESDSPTPTLYFRLAVLFPAHAKALEKELAARMPRCATCGDPIKAKGDKDAMRVTCSTRCAARLHRKNKKEKEKAVVNKSEKYRQAYVEKIQSNDVFARETPVPPFFEGQNAFTVVDWNMANLKQEWVECICA